MAFDLPKLPYGYDALEPYINTRTMTLHHDMHHAGYVKGLNAAVEGEASLAGKSPEELVAMLASVPEAKRTAIRNSGGGHVNHSMFWNIMGPKKGGAPSGELGEAIDNTFGSFENFKDKFNGAGGSRFGSGWAWLIMSKAGRLEITSTPNQDNPMTDGHQVIMGNDVWEHAYYLTYENRRAEYLKNWWNVVNWDEVAKRFAASK